MWKGECNVVPDMFTCGEGNVMWCRTYDDMWEGECNVVLLFKFSLKEETSCNKT